MIWLRQNPHAWGAIRPLVTASGRIVLVCDETEEVWLHPDDIDGDVAPIYPSAPDWTVIEGVSIAPGTTRWATHADLAGLDWDVEWHDKSTSSSATAIPRSAHGEASTLAYPEASGVAWMMTALDRIAPALPPEGSAALSAATRRWLGGSTEPLEPWARMIDRLAAEAVAAGEASQPATKALEVLRVVLDDDLDEHAIDTFEAATRAFDDSQGTR